tara:strand:+ start:1057 stop:1266 length:210 start_codon:yes stop_codon:yes gene_type:complete
MELNQKAILILEKLTLKKRIKTLERQLAKLTRKDIAREERRKKFNITSIDKIKKDGHWYFKGTDILSCQ